MLQLFYSEDVSNFHKLGSGLEIAYFMNIFISYKDPWWTFIFYIEDMLKLAQEWKLEWRKEVQRGQTKNDLYM